MKNKGSTPAGKPIRGTLEPFLGTEIEILSWEIHCFHIRNTNAPEDYYFKLRNLAKEYIGELFRRGAKQCGRYKQITDKSRDIILTYLRTMKNHPHCSTFVSCVLDAYNDENLPTQLNPPSCKTKEIKKAMQHANKDSLKGFYAYVAPIFKYMSKHEGNFSNDALGRYRDIEGAVAFTRHFFMKLFCGRMPKTISVELYDRAKELDIRIASHYVFHAATKQYKLHGQRLYMCSAHLNQECITQILCYSKTC